MQISQIIPESVTMPEQGGTSTQAGIYYQNTVAALALLEMLDLAPGAARERVLDVRVEAPSHVDDIVVRFADGHFQYWNVKLKISQSDMAWRNLWKSLSDQWSSSEFSSHDQLTIIIGEPTTASTEIHDLCERARTSMDQGELSKRLNKRQTRLLSNIKRVTGLGSQALDLLRNTSVRHLTEHEIEREFNRKRLSGEFVLPKHLLTVLRDIVGSKARRRGYFVAPQLRKILSGEHGIEISEPNDWGLPAYRSVIEKTSNIEIPGTRVFGSAEELFVWPRARAYDTDRVPDFEDEGIEREIDPEPSLVDLKLFPSIELSKAIVVAGPGHGKSALLTAISAKLSSSPYVPVLIPLSSLGASDLSFMEFLSSNIERELSLRADWQRLAEQGLLVLLLDGLDEVPPDMRPILLNRLSAFAVRYPNVPWLLTVRDPAVLTGTNEAQVIELLALDDDDIVRFVDTLGNKLDLNEGWVFLNTLKLYPDLEKLARIPLFLSMLLATMDLDKVEAVTRSDLIESYLKTLFVPSHHKATTKMNVNAMTLRAISEKLAFDNLERQEIGASEREVRKAISIVAPSPDGEEEMFERLLANGVLKQQSSIRYQFPYPIVQEYLAACHLVAQAPDSLPSRLDDAIQRPWAQVIQFALEQVPDANAAIGKMLDREDDAFMTGLRLVGRCISNGANVTEELAQNVGDKLTEFWIHAPTRARERTGRLLMDGFCSPPSAALSAALHHRWLISSGAGDIVAKLGKPELTLSVFKALLSNDTGTLRYYHSLRPALNSIGDQAIQMIIDFIDTPKVDAEKTDDVLSVLGNFSPVSVNRDLVLKIALNEGLSNQSRMRAFELAGKPLDERAMPLVETALRAEDWDEHYEVRDLIKLIPRCNEFLLKVFENPEISKDRKIQVVESLPMVLPNDELRKKTSQACLESQSVDCDVKMILKLFEARFGQRDLFVALIEDLSDIALEYAGATVSLFGHYQEKGLAELAADKVSKRRLSAADAVYMAQSAATGMRYIFEMNSFRSGALQSSPPHPGANRWIELVEDWCGRDDLEDRQRMQIANSGARLGSFYCSRKLESILTSIVDFDDDKWGEDEYANALSNALHELRRIKPVFPDVMIDRLLQSQKYNVASHGIYALEAKGTKTALQKLIKAHSDEDEWHRRDTLANAIETLSSKLSLPVGVDGDGYKIL